jgi:hypothetical protein
VLGRGGVRIILTYFFPAIQAGVWVNPAAALPRKER